MDLPVFAMTAESVKNRFIEFASQIIGLVEAMPSAMASRHIAMQLLSSGTSPAPNYGEARGAESHKDFIHKVKISLKELLESLVWLKILSKRRMADPKEVAASMRECDELIAIFVSTTKTADRGRQ